MFPRRFAVTRIENIAVIPIWADPESVYNDMMVQAQTDLNSVRGKDYC